MSFAHTPTLPDSHTPTLVVESVSPDSPAAKAGVKVGDRLVTYDGKPLPSPAALQAAQQNTFGKKEVALSLQRGEEMLTLNVPLGALGIAVRPELPPDVLKLYEQGNPSRDGDGAVKAWAAAAKAAQDAGDKAAAAWLYGRVGGIYEGQRKWQEARLAHTAAWELLGRQGSASWRVDAAAQSRTLAALGRCSQNLNDLPAAQGWYDHAAQVDEAAGNEMWAAGDLNDSGIVSYYRGNLSAAHEYHTRALKIHERLAPDSLDVAVSLNNLGNVARERGDLSRAQDYYTRAITLVESQRRQIASTEERALLVEQYTQPYTGLLKTYLALNDLPAAFTTLERAHARSLVELLNKRQLAFHADAPADLLKQQDTLDSQRAAVNRQLAKLDPQKDDEKRGQLLSQLTSFTAQQQTLATKIRDAAPQFADLQYPQPLDFQAAQAALDKGTVLLSYFVDEEETYLFVIKGKEGEGSGRKGTNGRVGERENGGKGANVTGSPTRPFTHSPTQIQLFRLKVTAAELRERVERFRLAVAHQGVFRQRGRALYDLLVRPAQAEVDKAQRVLICPDGPLHTLPFAALVVNQGKEGEGRGRKGTTPLPPRYFIEAKPLHTIVSMTVYAELRKQTHQPTNSPTRQPILLAMGDPQYDAVADKVKQDARRSGMELTRLPNTRKEVEAIGRLYGSQARVRVGLEASETAAKLESGGATVLHFACHGLLDNREPLESGLALTATGGDDGVLRAWEIFEGVRFNADSVVLSACETGLGEEMKNEGIVGLTRALQYAGAKSVVVSLWKIADESTSQLMVEFYRQRKAGKSKDEALRQAQLTLLRSKTTAHPFYWAAFVLAGDWR